MKTNITLLLPLEQYKKELSKLIANKLGMLFVDVNELLQFELIDLKRVLTINGKEYLDKEESKLIKRVSTYNNALITLQTGAFLQEENRNILKQNTLIVYLKFTTANYFKLLKKEKKSDAFDLDIKLFEERSRMFEKEADVVVECVNANKRDIIKQLMLELNNYYVKEGK